MTNGTEEGVQKGMAVSLENPFGNAVAEQTNTGRYEATLKRGAELRERRGAPIISHKKTARVPRVQSTRALHNCAAAIISTLYSSAGVVVFDTASSRSFRALSFPGCSSRTWA